MSNSIFRLFYYSLQKYDKKIKPHYQNYGKKM